MNRQPRSFYTISAGQLRRVSLTPVRMMLTLSLLLLVLGSLTLAYTFGQVQPRARAQTATPQSTKLTPTSSPFAQASSTPTSFSQATSIHAVLPLQPLWQGNRRLPEIALTFDDGPHPYFTPQILAILQRFHIQATFFCVGQLVARYPGIVAQAYLAGNLIEDHTWSHPNLRFLNSAAINQQMAQDAQAIEKVTGEPPTFFRPPYGAYNATIMAQAHQLDLSTIMWSVDPRDWTQPGVNVLVTRVVQATSNGAIILLHDGGGNRAQTVAALPAIITALQQRGLRFVTIQQMINDLAA